MKKKVSPKKDQYTVVLEDVRSHLKSFGEAQQITNSRLESIEERLESLGDGLDQVKSAVMDNHEGRITKVEKIIAKR